MDGPTFHLSHSDAVAWLRSLPSESIDLVITDPPYESLEKHRAIGTTTRLKHSKASSNDWFSIFPNARFPELFEQVYRVLKKNSHFYLFCDPETMFVAKPIGEAAGFKFWKPIIWDKCLGPETLVWTERGVIRIDEIVPGDRVAIPEGGTSVVRATRRVRAPSVQLTLSDGTTLTASREHRFLRADGTLVEAASFASGDAITTRAVRERRVESIDLDEVIPVDDAVFHVSSCWWCGVEFDSPPVAATHQARCEAPVSKRRMAEQLGIEPKRLRRWMDQGRIPFVWAKALGLEDKLGNRVQGCLQSDVEAWYPRTLMLDYEFGKVIGLYAAEGCRAAGGVSFTFHASETHLHSTVARFARSLGVRSKLVIDGTTAKLSVSAKVMGYLVDHFVGGDNSLAKFFRPIVYAAPSEFRRGILAGMLEGDGHWSQEEQRETYVSASPDLSMFVRRELEVSGRCPVIRPFENGWRVRFDPIQPAAPLTVMSIEDGGECELVDISITDRDEQFLLANGAVTHNCTIGMGYHYRARYECILFFEKGKRKLNDLGVPDILQAKRINGGYPAEKPPSVSETLIRQSTELGELVIDPFMGSGSVGVAAVTNQRSFRGNDLCEEAVDITRSRLRDAGAREAGDAPMVSTSAQLGLL